MLREMRCPSGSILDKRITQASDGAAKKHAARAPRLNAIEAARSSPALQWDGILAK